ncbi:MAG: hypothetical protein PHD32_05770 [Eubacteriales bacterium]|nr:hypothetical protein [Eubacteriales bacterium]
MGSRRQRARRIAAAGVLLAGLLLARADGAVPSATGLNEVIARCMAGDAFPQDRVDFVQTQYAALSPKEQAKTDFAAMMARRSDLAAAQVVNALLEAAWEDEEKRWETLLEIETRVEKMSAQALAMVDAQTLEYLRETKRRAVLLDYKSAAQEVTDFPNGAQAGLKERLVALWDELDETGRARVGWNGSAMPSRLAA